MSDILDTLSPEYRAQMEDQLRKREMARAMIGAGMKGPQMPQQIGNQAARMSPLAALLPVLQMYMGQRQDAEAGKKLSEIQGQQDAATQKTLGDFQRMQQPTPGAPAVQGNNPSAFIPEQAPTPGVKINSQSPELAKLLVGRDPRVSAYAKNLQTMLAKREEDEYKATQDRLKGAATAATAGGDSAGAVDMLRGNAIPDKYAPPALPAPRVERDPITGKPFIVNTGLHKQQTGVSFGNDTTVQIAGKEGELSLKREQEDLEKSQANARIAMENIGNSQRIRNLLRDGAQTGGLESYKQSARKVLEGLAGVQIPETGMTDELRSQLGSNLLAKAKLLGSNPSEGDAKRIEQIVGSIDTDPMALARLAALVEAKANKDLQDFGDFVGTKRNSKSNPSLYDTADIGIRGPGKVDGTDAYKLLVSQAMRQYGGDPTKLGLPDIEGDAEMRFSLPALVGRINPASPAAVKTKPKHMTQKAWDELQMLEKELGGGR